MEAASLYFVRSCFCRAGTIAVSADPVLFVLLLLASVILASSVPVSAALVSVILTSAVLVSSVLSFFHIDTFFPSYIRGVLLFFHDYFYSIMLFLHLQ